MLFYWYDEFVSSFSSLKSDNKFRRILLYIIIIYYTIVFMMMMIFFFPPPHVMVIHSHSFSCCWLKNELANQSGASAPWQVGICFIPMAAASD